MSTLFATTIANAKPRERPYKMFDGGGLHLFVKPNGSKLWRLNYSWLTRMLFDDKVELTGGLRYFRDNQSLDEQDQSPSRPLINSKAKFEAVTPRVVLAWHPERNLNFYASYSQGFRSGLLQQPSVLRVAPQFLPARPDRLHNYEVGAKGSLWGAAVGFDAAVFYIDWQDIQQTLSVEPGANNPALNANSASGIGAEYSITLKPVKRLTLTHIFSWNGLTLDSDVISGGEVLFPKGARLGSSPEYTYGFSADYVAPLGNGFELTASASASDISRLMDGRAGRPHARSIARG